MFEMEVNENIYLKNSLSRILLSWFSQDEFDRQRKVVEKSRREKMRRREIRLWEHYSMPSAASDEDEDMYDWRSRKEEGGGLTHIKKKKKKKSSYNVLMCTVPATLTFT